MSAPFIPIPQSKAPGRVHDFIDEFNRVAADPDLGASLEELQKGAKEFATRPVGTLDEKDLVAKLINDNKALWEKLLKNDFCQNYMKTKTSADAKTLEGFKWYFRQDFIYIVKQCQYQANRGLKATNTKDFEEAMGKVANRANDGKAFLKTCSTAPPTGLGIRDSVVLSTAQTQALKDYIALLTEASTTQNWVMSLVAMIPCVQSYYLIAVDLHKNSLHKDTPWYKLWVEENIKYEDSTKKQIQFFITNYEQWKPHYADANAFFKRAVQAEINLWGTALNPGH